jgi:hypothetical protein
MDLEFNVLTNTIGFWVRLCFETSGLTEKEMEELEEIVGQICLEAIASYQKQPNKEINHA